MLRLSHRADFDSLVPPRLDAFGATRIAGNVWFATQDVLHRLKRGISMQTYLQRGRNSDQSGTWLRLIATLCILMVTFMSAAQACHTHAEASSLRQSSQHHQPAPEDHCLVCVAMHTAIPETTQALPETTVDVARYMALPPSPVSHSTLRTFDLQTRPPPAA